jgi:hypothetical protein
VSKGRFEPGRWWPWVLFGPAGVAAASVLFFAVLEIFPGLIQPLRLEGIRYLAMRSRYRPDRDLVLVPRRHDHTLRGRTRGDLYRPELGVQVPSREFEASYNDLGFRANSSTPPYRVMVIGDSYVEIGDFDRDTLSERLRAATGWSAFNAGRGWYGPFQYVEIFRRLGPELGPDYAVLCFFAGNDIEDIRQFERWQRGEGYYNFKLAETGFFGRYWTALRDTARALRNRVGRSVSTGGEGSRPTGSRPVEVRLDADTRILRVHYEAGASDAGRLVASDAWLSLRVLLAEFRDLAKRNGIRPLVVFIPTKLQVYRPLVVDEAEATGRLLASREALARITEEVGLAMVDLLPAFRRSAEGGQLLYYPYDTHWNGAGRQLAAEQIASFLLDDDNDEPRGRFR